MVSGSGARWGEILPEAGVAAAVLVLPGLVVLLALRVRGLLAVCLAPLVSVSLVAVVGVGSGLLGMPFGVLPVVVLTAAAVLVAALWALVPERWSGPVVPWEGRTACGAAAGGGLVGGVFGALATLRATGPPDDFPQQFDSLFHVNAVWHVVTSGDGSSLTLGRLAAPGRASAFYPAAWHDVTALVVEVTGVGVVRGVNVVAVMIAAVVWPASLVALARVAYGVRPLPLAVTGGLAAAVAGGPLMLLGYGTVWPNALATSLVPAMLALLVVVVGVGRSGPALSRPRAAVIGALGAPGLALAHPNAAVTVFLLGVLLVVMVWLGRRWVWQSVPLVAGAVWLLLYSPVFAANRGRGWPTSQTSAQAAGEWLLLAPQRAPIPWVVAALAAAGVVLALRRPRLRWLAAVQAALGVVFVTVAGSDGEIARRLGALWWDDAYRLGALVAIGAIPLAALAVATASDRAVRALRRSPRAAATLPVAALLLVAVVAWRSEPAVSSHISVWHSKKDMAGPDEIALLERLPDHVPERERVLGTPWNGSALAQSVGDREVVFPHLVGTWDSDRALLATRLADAASDPAVCRAVRHLDAWWVLDGAESFWPGDERQRQYAGLHVAGRPGFEPVDRGGRLTLYRVTACT